MKIFVQGVLDEKVFFNVDFFNKESITTISSKNNNYHVYVNKNILNNSFGITLHNLYDFKYDKELKINIELEFNNIKGNLKYFDGNKYIIDNEQKIENNILRASINLNKWHHKCRFFIDNLNIDWFILKKFNIQDKDGKLLFYKSEWTPKLRSHYSLVKSYFLYQELKNIFTTSDVFMITYSKYNINYIFENVKYCNLNNIITSDDILYFFSVNHEYYDILLKNQRIKDGIDNNNIKLIFRSCRIPNTANYDNSLFFIQNGTINLPKSITTIYGRKSMTVNDYIENIINYKKKQRIFINTMGISSNTKYYNDNYNDNKIHILFMGRLVRLYNLIKFINKIDTLLDNNIYVIDILPGIVEYNKKKYDPRIKNDFLYIKSLFNNTINVLSTVQQKDVANFIIKSDIGIDFPTQLTPLSIVGPENCKLYEYISLGLPTVSQTTPNSFFISKYNCGKEINKICSPKDYYDGIIQIASNLKNYNRKYISKKFIEEYSYKNLTYKLLRNILSFYKDLPEELLGDWNYSKEKIVSDTSYLTNHKFLDRNRTIKSNWERLIKHFPDLFKDNKKKLLDLSCGNGATLEILRFLGHKAFGVDYESNNHCFDKPLFHSTLEMNNTWPYKILLESQNLKFKGHDLNVIPYPFENNSFDIVNSWGAIEFYGRPKYWKVFILEMLRITKEYVNIAFNDISSWLKDNDEYVNEYNNFFSEIENHFFNYNVKIEKVSDKHYKFYKKGEITNSMVKKSVNDIIKVPKLNIIILIDIYEWAYHYDALDMKNCLEQFSDINISIELFDKFYSDSNNYNNYDLIYVLCAYKLKDIDIKNIIVNKTITFITSHYSHTIINSVLSRCKYCLIVNNSIRSEFQMNANKDEINKIFAYNNFWNNDIFYKKKIIKNNLCSVKLVIGFCGKENEHKGYHIYEELKKNNSFNFLEATDKKRIKYEDMNNFYNKLDIMLSISLDEGNPNPAFESALTGTIQLVSCNKSYIYENINDNHNGCIVERNIDSILNKLNHLNENRDFLNRIKQNSYNYFNNKISIGASYEYFLSLTKDIYNNDLKLEICNNILVDSELNSINSILTYYSELFNLSIINNCLQIQYSNDNQQNYTSSGIHFKVKTAMIEDYNIYKFKFNILCNKPLKLTIYTGIKWIEIDNELNINEFNHIEIKEKFIFNTVSKYRIGFKYIENNCLIKIKDIEFI